MKPEEHKFDTSSYAVLPDGVKRPCCEAKDNEIAEQARLNGMGAERELKLKAELERIERNRDMWKSQVARQAETLASLRAQADALAEALRECKVQCDEDMEKIANEALAAYQKEMG